MNSNDLSTLRLNLYKRIKCPECNSETSLKYQPSGSITCSKCKTKYSVIDGVPILLSEQSQKMLNPQLHSQTGKKMLDEYSGKKTFLKSIKKLIKVPNLAYNLVDRNRLHKIFTYDENRNCCILNVGGGPTREDSNVLNLNIDIFPNVEVVADAHNLPFKTGSIDSIMIAAVLEHVQNPNKVVEEAYRVLKKGGYIYAETPFLQHFHGYPNHFQNFTLVGHDYIFRKFKKIESGPTTGPFSSILILISNLFEDLIDNKYIRKISLYCIATVLWPFKFLDFLTKKNKNIYKLTSGVYFLGQKI